MDSKNGNFPVFEQPDVISYKLIPRPKPIIYLINVKDMEESPKLKIDTRKGTEEETKFICPICKKEQATQSALIRHKRIHNQPTTCDICGEKFQVKSELKKHLFRMHQKIEQGFICEICGRSCPDARSLNRHQKYHTDEKPFECGECGKHFKNKRLLNRHLGVHADNQERYVCDTCGKNFNRKEIFTTHVKTHSECNFQCEICKRMFPTETGLQIHISSKHINFVPNVCKICGKESCEHSGTNSKKSDYVPRKLKVKNKACPECGKVFVYDSEVKYHVQVHHSDEKKFVCAECGKEFKTLNCYKIHERVHLDQRPYPCKICDKKFRTLSHIKQHVRTHTGEKPYVCPVCDRGFAQNGDMKKHVLKIHGVKYEEIKK